MRSWRMPISVRRESECPIKTEVRTRFDESNPHENQPLLIHSVCQDEQEYGAG